MRVVILNRRTMLVIALIIGLSILSVIVAYSDRNKVLEVFTMGKILPIYSVEAGEKKIAIRFDAAWGDAYTDEILHILEEYDVKTTFFLVGFWVDKYPDMVKKIHEAGHEIGNHSTTHPDMSKLSKQEIKRELNTTSSKIEKITGEKPFLFRAPFGAYNNLLISTASELGYYTVQWDIDSLDWKELGSRQVVDIIVNNIEKGSIVLFHNNAKYVSQFLPVILEELRNEGYTVVPISSLIIKENYFIDHSGRQKEKEDS